MWYVIDQRIQPTFHSFAPASSYHQPAAFMPSPASQRAEQACDTKHYRQQAIDLVVMGLNENGHIAFNDPPYTDLAISLGGDQWRVAGASRWGRAFPSPGGCATMPSYSPCLSAISIVPEKPGVHATNQRMAGSILRTSTTPVSIWIKEHGIAPRRLKHTHHSGNVSETLIETLIETHQENS